MPRVIFLVGEALGALIQEGCFNESLQVLIQARMVSTAVILHPKLAKS